ncbi:hypothetical protein UACE39S_00968 [Ureibacillus acetophenoni]
MNPNYMTNLKIDYYSWIYRGRIQSRAFILHVPSVDLPEVIGNIERALKPGGYFYVSFKYGDFEGERNGRYFTNQTEQSLEELLKPFKQLELLETSVTPDVRAGRGDEMWLNAIVRKK